MMIGAEVRSDELSMISRVYMIKSYIWLHITPHTTRSNGPWD